MPLLSERRRGQCPVRFAEYKTFPNSQILRSSDSVCVRYPLERLAQVCPFFEGLLNVPQPTGTPPPAPETCPHAAGRLDSVATIAEVNNTVEENLVSVDTSTEVDSVAEALAELETDSASDVDTELHAEVDESAVIDLPVPWGGLKLCLELVDAHLTCPALGGTRLPESPTTLLRHGVDEHINSMIETAHAFGLTFIGTQVFHAFAGQPVPSNGGSSDPLWIFAVVASTGANDVLIPAAWNTLRSDFDIFRGSLQGKRLLLKFAQAELRELYVLHHAWHYAIQVYEDTMLEGCEWEYDGRCKPGESWERGFRHEGCPYPSIAMVAADARNRVKKYLYSHPRRSERSLEQIIDTLCDPVQLTDVIFPAMSECATCVYSDGALLDTFVRVVQQHFVEVLKAEVLGLRYLGGGKDSGK